MRMRICVSFGVALACLGLTTCAKNGETSKITLIFERNAPGTLRSKGVVDGGSQYDLPADYCYGLHITAPAGTGFPMQLFSNNPGCSNGAIDPPGLGVLVGTSAVGERIDVDVPVGAQRRFDLIAIPKSIAGANCPKDLHAVVTPRTAASGTNDPQVDVFLGGKRLPDSDESVLIMAMATQDIKGGANTVVLKPVSGPLPTGVSLAFGTIYGCGGTGGGGNGTHARSVMTLPLLSTKPKLSFRMNAPTQGPRGNFSTNSFRGLIGYKASVNQADSSVGFMFEVGPDGAISPQVVRRSDVQVDSAGLTCSPGNSIFSCTTSFSPLVWGGLGGTSGGGLLSVSETPRSGGSADPWSISGTRYDATGASHPFRAGQPNGYVPILDVDGAGSGKFVALRTTGGSPYAYLHIGAWDAGTNAPTLLSGSMPVSSPSPTVDVSDVALYYANGTNEWSYASVVGKDTNGAFLGSMRAQVLACQVPASPGAGCEASTSTSWIMQNDVMSNGEFAIDNHIFPVDTIKVMSVSGYKGTKPWARFYGLIPSPTGGSGVLGGGDAIPQFTGEASAIGSDSPAWSAGQVNFVRSSVNRPSRNAVVMGGHSIENSTAYSVAYKRDSSNKWHQIYRGPAGRTLVDGQIFSTSRGDPSKCYDFLLFAEAQSDSAGVPQTSTTGGLYVSTADLDTVPYDCSNP